MGKTLSLIGCGILVQDFLLPLCEAHVVVANQVVALDSGTLGSLAVTELLVGQHRLADVNAAVVDQVDLQNLSSACLENLAHALPDAVVSHVAQMQRLVGIRAAELDHDLLSAQDVGPAVLGGLLDDLQIEVADHLVHVQPYVHVGTSGKSLPVRLVRKRIDIRAQLLSKDVRSLREGLCIGKERECQVSQFRFGRNLKHHVIELSLMTRVLIHQLKSCLNQAFPLRFVYHFLFLMETSPVERIISFPSSPTTCRKQLSSISVAVPLPVTFPACNINTSFPRIVLELLYSSSQFSSPAVQSSQTLSSNIRTNRLSDGASSVGLYNDVAMSRTSGGSCTMSVW